jgi:hypothetical protein
MADGILTCDVTLTAPQNDQIDVALNSFLASKVLSNPPEKLSAEGKALVADARNVVKQAQHLLLSKNQGNLLQDFIWQTEKWDAKTVNVPGAPVDKDTAQQHGEQALQGLRTLGTLLITNGQFRKLLRDSSVLLRDIAGDAATNAASRVRPSEEQLRDIDAPAQDNTWHDAPDFSKETLKKQAQGVYKGNAKQDAREIAQAGTQHADPNGSQNPRDVAQTAAADHQQGTASGVDAVGGIKAAKNVAERKLNENVDQETRDNAQKRNEEYRRRAREYLGKKMPQERREQTIWRLKKMVLECQQHPDYAQAIETILNLAEEYSGHSRALAQGSSGTVKEARGGLAQAESDLRTLIERFANGTSTEDLWTSINQIYQDAERDPELKDWFKAMNQYIRRCLLQQGYILEDASTDEWHRLYDHGRYLLREKYRGHTDRVVDEIRFIINEFDNDPQNKAFGQSIQKLFTDLGNDDNGKPTFKPHLVKDLTEVIVPAIFENVAYIPIPRMEFSDHQFDAIIENLVLESDNFMPNVLEINSEHHFRWGRKKIANKNKQVFDIRISGVQLDLRDVSYHIKRKQGFPSITDTGVADFLLPGDGLCFKIKMSTADKSDRQNFFKIEKVDVDFKHMNIKLKQSNHKLLFGLFKPLMLKVMRPALQKAFEKSIKDQANQLDTLLYQIKQEADRAVDEARSDPEQAPNIYNRYYTATQKRFLQNKEKAKKVAEDKKVNVAMTQEDSIFPKIKLPGGISSKATEYRDLARKGERWESPVFSIGKANKSTDIPEAPKVQRKPHSVRKQQPVSQDGYNQDGYNQGSQGGYAQGGQAGYGQQASYDQGYQGQNSQAFGQGVNGTNPAVGSTINTLPGGVSNNALPPNTGTYGTTQAPATSY